MAEDSHADSTVLTEINQKLQERQNSEEIPCKMKWSKCFFLKLSLWRTYAKNVRVYWSERAVGESVQRLANRRGWPTDHKGAHKGTVWAMKLFLTLQLWWIHNVHVCQNRWNCPSQRVKFNVYKVLKTQPGGRHLVQQLTCCLGHLHPIWEWLDPSPGSSALELSSP